MHLSRAMVAPAAQKWVFSDLGSVKVILWFQVGSGAWFWVVCGPFFGYLEMSFVDDFEKVLVFVRCVNSILIPVFLLPC